MLDYTVFGYLDKCLLLNNVLARHFGCFLRFYERRNKYRYQLRKKLKSKNEMCAEISSCAKQNFHGYEFLREELRHYEKKILSCFTLSTSHQKTRRLQFTVSLNQKFTWHMQHFISMVKKEQLSLIQFNSVLIARIFFENLKKPCQNTSGVVLASLAILKNLTIL